MAKAIPEGYHTVTPYICVKDTAAAIEFYKRAFGAKELYRMPMPGGKTIMHAEIMIGDSQIMMSDEMPGMGGKSPTSLGGSHASLHLYSDDVDAAFKRAVDAGAKPDMPPMDMFWGDRFAKVTDPFGQPWSIATHKEDVSPEEMDRRSKEWFASMSKGA